MWIQVADQPSNVTKDNLAVTSLRLGASSASGQLLGSAPSSQTVQHTRAVIVCELLEMVRSLAKFLQDSVRPEFQSKVSVDTLLGLREGGMESAFFILASHFLFSVLVRGTSKWNDF